MWGILPIVWSTPNPLLHQLPVHYSGESKAWVLSSDPKYHGQIDLLPPLLQHELGKGVHEGERELVKRKINLSNLSSPDRSVTCQV